MRTLDGTEVEANIKVKGAPRLDVNSLAIVDQAKEDAVNANDSHDGHPSAHGFPSTEAGNEIQAPNDTIQIIKRQEGDIIIILQTLETLQKEMKSFQKDMKSVKVAVNDIRTRQDQQQTPELSEDIELLTETMAGMSGKVGELDALKLESKMMQSRVKRLEDDKRGLQTSMEPLSTPRPTTNSAKPVHSIQKAEEKMIGNAVSSPRRNVYSAGMNPTSNRSRAASVQGSDTPRISTRNDMPPPEQPRSQSGRLLARPSSIRSASETGDNPHRRSNLHHTISSKNDSASEVPPVTQDDEDNDEDNDEEYHVEESTPDPDDETYRPRRSRSRQSLPTRIASHDTLGGDRYTNSNKRRRTTSHALNRDNNTPPSPHPDDPNYRSIWAAPNTESDRATPAPALRNEHGFIIKPNGQIDKRSLRFLGKVKKKRRSVAKHAARDSEGYLLEPDGTRNERSVRIIDGMRKRDRDERDESLES